MKRILIIEDDEGIRDALSFALDEMGYAVEAAPVLQLSEAFLASPLPDVICLDMYLAGRRGDDIVRELKAHPATRHIPVVMMSAQPREEEGARRSGADAFLSKPFTLEALAAVIASSETGSLNA
jgi:CheY-like chemotaxis protein